MKKSVLLLLMFTITIISVNGQELKTTVKSAAGDSTTIAFTETTHGYGTMTKGADGNYTFTFKNTGSLPLVLTNVKSSCGCTVATWPREPIAPGKTGEIKVKYDTNRAGPFQKTITVTSNAKTTVLIIKGTVQ